MYASDFLVLKWKIKCKKYEVTLLSWLQSHLNQAQNETKFYYFPSIFKNRRQGMLLDSNYTSVAEFFISTNLPLCWMISFMALGSLQRQLKKLPLKLSWWSSLWIKAIVISLIIRKGQGSTFKIHFCLFSLQLWALMQEQNGHLTSRFINIWCLYAWI